MGKYTTIPITDKTRTRLKALKFYPKESLEKVILRLLDVENKGVCYYNISEGMLKLECSVDWDTEAPRIVYYDEDNVSMDRLPFLDYNGWYNFSAKIMWVDNLVNILSVLDVGDVIMVNGLSIERLK